MLTWRHRFHGRSSLAQVYRHGQTLRGTQLGLRYRRNPQGETYRVAVIVSRKVHKSAVARNRLRRRIYEIVRTGPDITEPYDLVITVFSDQVSLMAPAGLTRAVHNLLQRARVYRQPSVSTSIARGIVGPAKG